MFGILKNSYGVTVSNTYNFALNWRLGVGNNGNGKNEDNDQKEREKTLIFSFHVLFSWKFEYSIFIVTCNKNNVPFQEYRVSITGDIWRSDLGIRHVTTILL